MPEIPATLTPKKTICDLPLLQKTSQRSNKNRIGFIDLTRGILFLLMTNTHAKNLAGVPENTFWYSGWWLPGGWATTSFIVLSGFSIGYIFDWRNSTKRINRKLLRRSREIFLVMFFSNIMMLFFSLLLKGQLSDMTALKWWIGLITFHTPYSISAILIPTSLLLIIAPALLALENKIPFSLLVISLGTVIWATFQRIELETKEFTDHISNIFFLGKESQFPILLFLTYGMIGLALGTLFQKVKKYGAIIIASFIILFLIITAYNVPEDSGFLELARFSTTPFARFGIILIIGFLLDKYEIIVVSKNLRIIGMFMLFSFIIHRIILQLFHSIILILYPTLNFTIEYFTLLISGMLSIGVLCYLRRYKKFNDGLKRIYL